MSGVACGALMTWIGVHVVRHTRSRGSTASAIVATVLGGASLYFSGIGRGDVALVIVAIGALLLSCAASLLHHKA
jgi:hypothetical protein